MTRLLRCTFHLATLLSVMLFAWVGVSDWLDYGWDLAHTSVHGSRGRVLKLGMTSEEGRIAFAGEWFASDDPRMVQQLRLYGGPPRFLTWYGGPSASPMFRSPGFSFRRDRTTNPGDSPDNVGNVSIAVPVWFLLLAFAILPARWCIHHRRTRTEKGRQSRGACLRCGYDLRATPGRCPECGTAATQPRYSSA